MSPKYYVGQRLSYDNVLCTVRYVGLIDGKQKEWLGVEWDNPLRGKHDGELEGKRYFTCQSRSKTGASFLRPARATDPPRSFVDAVHQKYATEITSFSQAIPSDTVHVISGKVVEEVGFDKIRQQLAQLQDLKIVIVDGLQINSAETADSKIRDVCPKIVELDLSRNLFERFEDIVEICGELDKLRSLRINGTRLRDISIKDHESCRKKLEGITDLELDDVLMSWEDIGSLTQHFPSLTSLTASDNFFKTISIPLPNPVLRSLTLEYNSFTSLSDLSALASLPSLEILLLKGNQISSVTSSTSLSPPIFQSKLHYIDLSYNTVTTWSFVNALASVFPGMTALRFAHNPIYELNSTPTNPSTDTNAMRILEEGYMLTLARLGQLKTLNFSTITLADRTNAEMYYLSLIGKALGEAPESKKDEVFALHPRYTELVEMYGEPNVVNKSSEAVNPNFLEARLIKFTFCYRNEAKDATNEESQKKLIEVPKSFDVFRVKGIVGRAFSIAPLSLKLTWETGEWDPVAGYEDEAESSDADGDGEEVDIANVSENTTIDGNKEEREKGKWMKREVEIEDGTRQIGFWIDGMEAIVRVELR